MFWLQASGSSCICSLLRLCFSCVLDLEYKAAPDCSPARKAGALLAPLGLWALCDGNEQMLEKSFTSPLQGTLSALELHCPVQSWGRQ